jgi:hypothetical protein
MSTITREQAKDLRNAFECWQQDYDPVEDKEQYDMFGMAIVAMDALLTSLEAEPAAMRWRYLPDGIHGMGEWNYQDQGYIDPLNAHHLSRQKELLYATPPAPVSVPEDEQCKPHPVMAVKGELGFLDHFDRIISERDEDIDIGQLGSGNYEALMLAALDAFRTAMLQGADGNSPVIPDGGEHGFCQRHQDTRRLTHPYKQLLTYPPRPSTYCPKCDPEVAEWVELDKQLRKDN